MQRARVCPAEAAILGLSRLLGGPLSLLPGKLPGHQLLLLIGSQSRLTRRPAGGLGVHPDDGRCLLIGAQGCGEGESRVQCLASKEKVNCIWIDWR